MHLPTDNTHFSQFFLASWRGAHFKSYDESTVYGPSSKYLIDLLLSGLSFKYNLTASPDMYGSLEDGLEKARRGSNKTELLLVGTCIQLLLHTSWTDL